MRSHGLNPAQFLRSGNRWEIDLASQRNRNLFPFPFQSGALTLDWTAFNHSRVKIEYVLLSSWEIPDSGSCPVTFKGTLSKELVKAPTRSTSEAKSSDRVHGLISRQLALPYTSCRLTCISGFPHPTPFLLSPRRDRVFGWQDFCSESRFRSHWPLEISPGFLTELNFACTEYRFKSCVEVGARKEPIGSGSQSGFWL